MLKDSALSVVGVTDKACMKIFIHEHKNFINDHHDHSMKGMINNHKQSCYSIYSMMYFMINEILVFIFHILCYFLLQISVCAISYVFSNYDKISLSPIEYESNICNQLFILCSLPVVDHEPENFTLV